MQIRHVSPRWILADFEYVVTGTSLKYIVNIKIMLHLWWVMHKRTWLGVNLDLRNVFIWRNSRWAVFATNSTRFIHVGVMLLIKDACGWFVGQSRLTQTRTYGTIYEVRRGFVNTLVHLERSRWVIGRFWLSEMTQHRGSVRRHNTDQCF